MTAADAAATSRRLSVPAPEAYKNELPKDLKLPAGVEFKFDDKDPVLGPVLSELRKAANELGFDQAGYSRMLGLHAAAQASEQAMLKAAHEAEIAKLGAAGTSRVGAMETFISAKYGPDALKVIMPSIVSAAQVEVWERVMKDLDSQGARGPQSAHRDRAEGNGTIPGYANMTFEQRRQQQDALRAGTR